MNELPPKHETQPEPQTLSGEKPPIRKAQEEYVDDMAGPSMDKSEYEQRKADHAAGRPASEADEAPRTPPQR